ncbi:MAG: hypothetical protein ACXWJB_01465 [Limisphaerales bacterium]
MLKEQLKTSQKLLTTAKDERENMRGTQKPVLENYSHNIAVA